MHQSAMFYGRRFFETYCPASPNTEYTVVEIGSQNVNGSLRDACHPGVKYIGLDFVKGEGVDIVISDPYKLPVTDGSADAVVTSSCFEHSEFFWLVFLEAMRILKPNGIFYLNVPSNGFFHQWPVDCWRFYPDSGHALVRWANRNGGNSLLLESFVGQRSAGSVSQGGMWNDFVAVILKDAITAKKYPERIIHSLSEFSNGYSSDDEGILKRNEYGPDFALLEEQARKIDDQARVIKLLSEVVDARDGQVTNLNQVVKECEGQINSLNQAITQLKCSRSWRVTSPLRKMMTFTRVAPKRIAGRVLDIYRVLPITPTQRLKLKNFLFIVFGFAFVRMDAYKRWKDYRHIHTKWASVPAISSARAASAVSYVVHSLPTSDGIWEWRDYDAVKSRISQIKAHQLSQVAPTPLDIIDIGKDSFESAAARIKLPTCSAEPDVSIILPVFNNLKLTLECLLSISAHTDSRISFEIILGDDASTDGTAQIVSGIANLRVIRNEQNLGFLRNCNKALEHVRGRYIVYLNNDVQVTQDWLVNLLETFSIHKNVGAVGSRFVYPSGHLQEAGVAFRNDGTADMVGLNDDSEKPRYSYTRRVDYISGACLMLPTVLARQLGGFSEDFLPCYCEDSDLCLRIQAAGYYVYYNPASTIIHHLSKTTAAFDSDFKHKSISANLVKLQQKWLGHLDQVSTPKTIAFYLPQFHPFPENDHWWGNGFTEWTNVTKARPNFVGHDQPRQPADLGFYDLRLSEIMQQQADLAQRYGIHGFCYYYYWFGGKRLLEQPIEQMLATGKPDMPFCMCWANENWTRRWDGQDHEVLMGQAYSPDDDEAVINDLIRYFRDPRYIRIDGRPMILVYRVTLFPDFSATVARWRKVCKEQGIGEIYVAMVESMELVHANKHPREFGCDAAVEFPPQEMAEQKQPSGEIINPDFVGAVADYRDIAVRYATREFPGYTRFKGVMPGWDNTARRQNNSFCFEHATPGTFQAWLEEAIDQTRQQHYGDERLVFVNAWNEWAEGAYLEPDRRFGHTYLEAVKNASEASRLLRRNKYWHGN